MGSDMFKPLVLAITLALVTPVPALAQTTAPVTTKQADNRPAPERPSQAWVAQSNKNAQILLSAQAPFQPEQMSFFGIPGYDDQVADLGPDNGKRFREATAAARAVLQTQLELERDANVRQDLQILLKAADEAVESSEVNERLTLPWVDVPQLVFQGLQGLLSDQTPPERRAQALKRLQRYAGLVEGNGDGAAPITTLARQRYAERAGEAALLKPTRIAVEQSLENSPTYLKGLRELFAKYKEVRMPNLRLGDGDVEALVAAVVAAAGVPVIVAGSVSTAVQIRRLAELRVWGFTVGTAIFERQFAPGDPSLRAQVRAVSEASRAASSTRGETL